MPVWNACGGGGGFWLYMRLKINKFSFLLGSKIGEDQDATSAGNLL
jgi:hypothetical protein